MVGKVISKVMTWLFYGLITATLAIFLIAAGIIGIAKLTTASAAAKSSQDQQWIDYGESGDGRIILQVDKNSINLSLTDKPATSLVGIRARMVPKDPLQTTAITEIIAVTNVQSCVQGQGKMFLGPVGKPDEGELRDWSSSSNTLLDFVGIAACSIGEAEVSRRNRTKNI